MTLIGFTGNMYLKTVSESACFCPNINFPFLMMGFLILTGHTAAQIKNYTLQLPFHPAAATLTTGGQTDSSLQLQRLHEATVSVLS